MDAIVIETLKQDVQQGRITADRLIELIASQQRTLQTVQQQLRLSSNSRRAQQRCAELSRNWAARRPQPTPRWMSRSRCVRRKSGKQRPARNPKPNARNAWPLPHQRQDRRGRTHRSGLSQGVPPEECRLSHVRPVWRLEKNRAVLIAYEIYRGPNSKYGQIPGVLGRSEFGLEIVTELAHLVYIVGLSFDKACDCCISSRT